MDTPTPPDPIHDRGLPIAQRLSDAARPDEEWRGFLIAHARDLHGCEHDFGGDVRATPDPSIPERPDPVDTPTPPDLRERDEAILRTFIATLRPTGTLGRASTRRAAVGTIEAYSHLRRVIDELPALATPDPSIPERPAEPLDLNGDPLTCPTCGQHWTGAEPSRSSPDPVAPLTVGEPATVTDEAMPGVPVPEDHAATRAVVPAAGVDGGAEVLAGAVVSGHLNTSYQSVSGRYTSRLGSSPDPGARPMSADAPEADR